MTLEERRAWVATCAGTDDVHVVEGGGLVEYRARRTPGDAQPDGRRLACQLRWDARRGRLDALEVSIDAAQDEVLDDALVAPYVGRVLDELTPSARAAAVATRWGSFAFGCVAPRSRAFRISCDVTQSLRRWTWRFQVRTP